MQVNWELMVGKLPEVKLQQLVVELPHYLVVSIRQVQEQLLVKFSKSSHITNSRSRFYGLRSIHGIMKLLKSKLMERWFGKEDSNGMKVISEKFVVAQFSNGKQCLQELKLISITPEIKLK